MTAWRPAMTTPTLEEMNVNNAPLYNPIWSGWIAEPTSSHSYIAVKGAFTQRAVFNSACAPTHDTSWVGIGGINTGALLQAGTHSKSAGPTYYAWYEYLGKNGAFIYETQMPNVDVNPGDGIYINVSYETANNLAHFYVEDTTNGSHSSLSPQSLGNNYYDGSTTEWIVERPVIGNSPTNLANFGQYNWTDTTSQRDDTTWIALGDSQNHYKATMTRDGSSGGHFLAHAGNLTSNTSFTDIYDDCS